MIKDCPQRGYNLQLRTKTLSGRSSHRALAGRPVQNHTAHRGEHRVKSRPAIIPFLVRAERGHDHGRVGFKQKNTAWGFPRETDPAIVEAERRTDPSERRDGTGSDRTLHV